jgi:DNA-binding CsgD family transcriptional regulator
LLSDAAPSHITHRNVSTSLPNADATALGSPDLTAATVPPSLLRLHGVLTQRDLWHVLRTLAREVLPSDSVTLEIGSIEDGDLLRVYRHAHAHTPPELRRSHPARHWFALHPGAPAYRLSDITSLRELRGTPFHERVMRREGWDKLLGIVSWRGRVAQGTWNFYRGPAQPDFSSRDLQIAEALQPHFHTALMRVLAHEQTTFLGEQFASLLEDVPVGLLLLDWDLRPLWFNGEAAHACAVWNHGERRAAALNPRRAFRVPAPLAEACADLRTHWTPARRAEHSTGPKPRVLSEHAIGLHAQVVLRALGNNPLLRPAFQIQLDYRRPRGDRNRPLSPGAVALLARLSAREREVAMRVREGLRTAEIAAELRRSPLTIKTQLAAIFTKLEVRSRTRVAALLNR